MWRILQAETASDYVLATGTMSSVRQFVEWAFRYVDIEIRWVGNDREERGIATRTGEILVEIDPAFYRPVEVERSLCDAGNARLPPGWESKRSVHELVSIMMRHELEKFEY